MNPESITLRPAPYVTIDLAECIIGLSASAIRNKIDKGQWLEGQQYRRGPDGRIYVSIEGFARWVESQGSMSEKRAFGSRSRSTGASSVAL